MNRGMVRWAVAVVGLGWGVSAGGTAAAADAPDRQAALERDVTQGALRIVKPDGVVVECPLKHTDVQAEVAGFIARVKVTQTFLNPTPEKIEAVYVFPLPHEAAVDDMTMTIAERRIVGVIKRRAEARRIYEEALLAGQTAALLEQERPNIFTQSVGNIGPGQEVHIEISYVDVLRYDMGVYEFHFPMVVGPRYNPGAPLAAPQPAPPELPGRVSPPQPDTTAVPDASRISPPVLKPDVRNGHDIALRVKLDAGVPIQDLAVPNHRNTVKRDGDRQAVVSLEPADSVPNKDFVLRYKVSGQKPEMAVLAHTGSHSLDAARLGTGYFLLMIQPREDDRLAKASPREIVFLCDVSGSMSGQPTAKVVEAMQHMLKLCRPIDTTQVVTFANDATKLFPAPLPVTPESIQRALNFTQGLRGGGGTEMLKGVKLAIDEPLDKERVRIVVMLTDGFIGNEAQIIEHVGKSCGDRVRFWALGIGSSPNMFLIDGVAKQGGGMGKRLGLEDDSAAMAQEVMTRIQRAQLAKLKIDWGPHRVFETYPAKLPELWAGRPVIVYGRYAAGGAGRITVSGEVEGAPTSWPLDVTLPAEQPAHDVLAKVWARHKIESLMQSTYYSGSPAVEEEVTALALDYRLMSQYTSFVAVDAKDAKALEPSARPPRRMMIPVPLPEGTQWEGFFGERAAPIELAEATKADRLAFSGSSTYGALAPAPTRPMSGPAAPLAAPAPGYGGPAATRATAAASPSRSREQIAGRQKGWSSSWAARGATEARKSRMNALAPMGGMGMGGMGGMGGGGMPSNGRAYSLKAAERESRDMLRRSAARAEPAADRADAYALAMPGADAADAKQATEVQTAAGAALKTGKELQKQGKLAEARATLLRAYLLAESASWLPGPAAQTADEALAAVTDVRSQQIAAWSKTLPALDKRLNLILRDRSVAEALDAIAQASGVTVKLVPGSIQDAAELTLGREPRVSHLDLRGAKVSEALEWILQPAKLSWHVADASVVAASDRRSGDVAAWVYDVSPIVLPTAEELKPITDAGKRTEAVKKTAERFLAAVRKRVGLDVQTALWFAPGQLLVIGDARVHTATHKLLSGLVDPASRPSGELDLYRAAVARSAAHKAAREQRLAAQRLQETAAAHAEFGWPLLAAAANGRVDIEALTELEIAWRAEETAQLAEGPNATVIMRSLWIVTESARAVPDNAELQALATAAAKTARPALTRLIEAKDRKPDAAPSILYGALALRDDSRIRQAATEAPAPPQAIARVLLAKPTDADRQWLATVAPQPGLTEDTVVLMALSARRIGGDTWQAFRTRLPELMAAVPLSGEVVVLLNRLANPALPLVAAR